LGVLYYKFEISLAIQGVGCANCAIDN